MKVEGLILVEGKRRCEIAVEPFDASVPWAEDRVVRKQALSVRRMPIQKHQSAGRCSEEE